MMGPFVPDESYVEKLARCADEGLARFGDVWPDGIPIDARDDGGLFHAARHVAYCARATEPDDDEMALFRELVAGLPERYALPAWRAQRTITNIVNWVRSPRRVQFVNRRAATPGRHPYQVFCCARHVIRVAAAGALRARGQTNAEIAIRLKCSERHVRTLIAKAGAPTKKRPRWEEDEVDALQKRVRERTDESERTACASFARESGRNAEAVLRQWKRIKRKDTEEQTRS